jgi:hypothetical protein
MAELETDQAEIVMRGLVSAVGEDGTLTDLQERLLSALGEYVIGSPTPLGELEPITPTALADALPDEALRRRVVHGMATLEIVTKPLPAGVAARVDEFARALHVDEGMLAVARDYAQDSLDIAVQDFLRSSYPMGYYADHAHDGALHQTTQVEHSTAAASQTADPGLEAKWKTLESCPSGSLGRTVWDFYQMRGFTFPGAVGAVDPLLAQHDWVHCLADYGTTPTGEIEVFTFLASAIPDDRGFSYVVVILGLFETGNFAVVPGVATANPGHLSAPDGPPRFADALKRGLSMNLDVMGGVDWFTYADTPIDDVRQTLKVPAKGADAIAAGSLAAMDPKAKFGATS